MRPSRDWRHFYPAEPFLNRPMKYLNIVHIPFGRGSRSAKVLIGDLWLQDIRAHVRALGGFTEVVIAAPLVDRLEPMAAGSFNLTEVNPADEGFEFRPIPHYVNMKQYLSCRQEQKVRLREIIQDVTLVHLGVGGHPVPVGQVAWPIAGETGKKRLFVFDGSDIIDRMETHAGKERNPLRRAAKRLFVRRFTAFCRRAIRESDLVFTHNRSVRARFSADWHEGCHTFDRTFVTPDMLIGGAEAEGRVAALSTPGPLRLVAAGRQIAIKATDHVLRAMAKAQTEGADIELDVLGDGEDLDRFKSCAAELGLSHKVRFLGTVPYGPQLFEVMKSAHALVVTNLTAEISRNVMIGMALGLPLITYRNPGSDEVIESAGAGLLVPTGDVDALATALIRAFRRRDELATMLRGGLAAAEANTLDACHHRRAELVRHVMESSRTALVGTH